MSYAERETFGLKISEVSRRTGIPITTLRFYERELPSLLPIQKTPGGHRRYGEEDVERFAAVRRLTRQGVRLARVRRVMMSRGENEVLREEVDRRGEARGTDTRMFEDLSHRLSELEARLSRLESVRPLKRAWFRNR